MSNYNTTKRYCPHLITTKINAVKLYRLEKDIDFVCRRYHISKASLMRWNKAYDGTKESCDTKVAQTTHNASKRSHRARIEMDKGLSQKKS